MAETPVDHAFLEWLRAATESAWRDYVPRDFQAAGVGGLDWKAGTRWRGGMTNAEIEAAEDRYGLTFAPDYRLFLATLHTPDPSMVGARFEGSHLVPKEGRSFPDWTGDPAAIETFIAWPLEGLIWSIEANQEWHPGWGPRPRGRRQREAFVRQLAAAGPQLVPVADHRYLAGPGDSSGNPVLSIYGSDVIVYAPDLRTSLPIELGLQRWETTNDSDEAVEPVSFWQDVIDGLPWPGYLRRPSPT